MERNTVKSYLWNHLASMVYSNYMYDLPHSLDPKDLEREQQAYLMWMIEDGNKYAQMNLMFNMQDIEDSTNLFIKLIETKLNNVNKILNKLIYRQLAERKFIISHTIMGG